MSSFSRLFLLLAAAMVISACQEQEPTGLTDLYSYLLLHPEKLKIEMNACQAAATAGTTKRCETVNKAGEQLLTMIMDQQKNPELFGQKILTAQMESAKADTSANNMRVKVMLTVVGLSSPE